MESSSPAAHTTTIPSIPVSNSSPSSQQPGPSSPKSTRPDATTTRTQKLQFLIRRTILLTARTADSNLTHLFRIFSTPSGTDSLLCTLGYTLALLHCLLNRLLNARLASIASSIADKAQDALLPGESFITSFPASTSTRLLAQTTESSKALSDLIADFRIFVRLWGMLGIYSWGKATWLRPPKERWLRAVTWGQIASCVLFQWLENVAYLASKGVLNGATWSGEEGAKKQTRWWVWSSRFWALHVALEGVRLGLLWRGRKEEAKEKGEEKEEKIKRKDEDRAWWRDAVSNVGYAPMTLHYSVEEGLVSETWVSLFGVVAGGALLRDVWRATA